MRDKFKKLGQVFTPNHIVDLILEELNYKEEVLLTKTIIEPSFGEGVFLINIVDKIIDYGYEKGLSPTAIKSILENNVYGIEIDKGLFEKTLKKLDILTQKHLIFNVKWNLVNENTIFYNYKDGIKFDYVVGNPPYIKIHNLSEEVLSKLNKFTFNEGMVDMYVLFFEIGLDLLNDTGKLGYITPNSYIKNTSQKNFREYLLKNNLIEAIIDFKSNKVFDNADTYTAITILNKRNTSSTLKYAYSNGVDEVWRHNIPLPIKSLNLSLNSLENTLFLKEIELRPFRLEEICDIQYGITTNRDKVYISSITPIDNSSNILFNGYEIEPNLLNPIKKGSKISDIKEKYVLFPYIWNENKEKYTLIEEKLIKEQYPLTYNYLLSNKETLLKRDIDKNTSWYEYGRSQGFKYLNEKRLTIGHIFKEDSLNLEIYTLDREEVLYSGIYIFPKNGFSIEDIYDILISPDFIKYCSIIGKDMSGGFKVVSAKNIKGYKPFMQIPL